MCRFDSNQYDKLTGMTKAQVTLDAYAADASTALTEEDGHDKRTFLSLNCASHTVWLDPRVDQTTEYLEHYHSCKATAPATTSAIVVIPTSQKKANAHLLTAMKLLQT